jgi:nucleoside triphosphate diphosphatase
MANSPEDTSEALRRLLLLMQHLRDPEHGCPWDRQQDFASIAPHTLEEVYEVVDAIERQDMQQLPDELGDLLFQVVFYAQLAKEQHRFDFGDVATAITQKLLHRHPHVFPDATLESFGRPASITAEKVVTNWEAIKGAERERKAAGSAVSVLDDVPLALPAIQRAAKLQKRARTQGFDWSDVRDVRAKVSEELAELDEAMNRGHAESIADEFGDLLFSMVNLGRHLQVDPERALRDANRKFEQRFRLMEAAVQVDGKRMDELTLAQLDEYWERAKKHAGKRGDTPA